jgi:hypothetical protein
MCMCQHRMFSPILTQLNDFLDNGGSFGNNNIFESLLQHESI